MKLGQPTAPLPTNAPQSQHAWEEYHVFHSPKLSMDRETAEAALQSESAGTWLIRYSTHKESYVRSQKLKAGKYEHILLNESAVVLGDCNPARFLYQITLLLLPHNDRFIPTPKNNINIQWLQNQSGNWFKLSSKFTNTIQENIFNETDGVNTGFIEALCIHGKENKPPISLTDYVMHPHHKLLLIEHLIRYHCKDAEMVKNFAPAIVQFLQERTNKTDLLHYCTIMADDTTKAPPAIQALYTKMQAWLRSDPPLTADQIAQQIQELAPDTLPEAIKKQVETLNQNHST